MKLYESNFNGQLSILDIVKDLAKLHPQIVAPHLATLLRIANGAKHDDVITVKEIESSCASAIIPGIIFFSFLYFFFFRLFVICFYFSFFSYWHHIEAPPSPPQEEREKENEDDGPDDFDGRVGYLNDLSTKCHDLPSLRTFLKSNAKAIGYLRVYFFICYFYCFLFVIIKVMISKWDKWCHYLQD